MVPDSQDLVSSEEHSFIPDDLQNHPYHPHALISVIATYLLNKVVGTQTCNSLLCTIASQLFCLITSRESWLRKLIKKEPRQVIYYFFNSTFLLLLFFK